MSNQKIRSLVYTAIFIALLGSGLWFLLFRADGLTADSAKEYYAENQAAFNDIASYMTEKHLIADVTAVPTPDEHFGIQSEDSDAYRSFYENLINRMRVACKRINSTGDSVEFYMPAKGGLLCQRHAVLIYGDPGNGIGDSAPLQLNKDGWYYCLVSGKP